MGFVLCGTALAAQDFGRYREFELGSDVTAVSTVTGTATSDLKVIHQRPALIQELTWRPKYGVRRPAAPDIQHGSPLLPSVTRKPQAVSAYGDPNTLIAQWGNVDNSVKLYRVSSYATRFRMVVAAEPIATLAHAAAARSLLLDEREAPQREAAREKKEAEDRRAAEEKARSTNKATFRP